MLPLGPCRLESPLTPCFSLRGNSTSLSPSRSFEPILRLLPQGISPVSQHWATWALYNLVSVYRECLPSPSSDSHSAEHSMSTGSLHAGGVPWGYRCPCVLEQSSALGDWWHAGVMAAPRTIRSDSACTVCLSSQSPTLLVSDLPVFSPPAGQKDTCGSSLGGYHSPPGVSY